ncbi:Sua5/YciO/YrdC/YwlC family protein [Synechococcus sp. PCC 7502]|uniref:L-threonylcarbamoyladenylate synthase n=1 Tax=Synechococcus sp. PCC 7502 TaxID=1173263 RepID=UPI00029FC4B6|nr:L-threonylcarbamoyladenylate synthase [Synechococcus sp. PCC 7502]AFY73875.1 Sua5/YciO/YrdC/YwlC family protein [Synechococcus sp. PCC 7502]
MAEIYNLNPETPQTRTVNQIVSELRSGAVMLYPTDTVYAIGCDLNSKSAVKRVRELKKISNDKPLTFLCPSLSNIAMYAQVHDVAYRLMRSLIPGAYTFILPATKLVPKLVMNPKRKTTGIRVPDSPICLALLESLGNPVISTSANLIEVEMDKFESLDISNPSQIELFDHFSKLVDVIVDNGLEPRYKVSTILDLTEVEPKIIRQGLGKLPDYLNIH